MLGWRASTVPGSARSRLGRFSVLILAATALLLIGSRDIPQPASQRTETISFRLSLDLETSGCGDLSFIFRDQDGDILLPILGPTGTIYMIGDIGGTDCIFGGDLSVKLPRALRYTVEVDGQRFGPMSYDSIRATEVWQIGSFGS